MQKNRFTLFGTCVSPRKSQVHVLHAVASKRLIPAPTTTKTVGHQPLILCGTAQEVDSFNPTLKMWKTRLNFVSRQRPTTHSPRTSANPQNPCLLPSATAEFSCCQCVAGCPLLGAAMLEDSLWPAHHPTQSCFELESAQAFDLGLLIIGSHFVIGLG